MSGPEPISFPLLGYALRLADPGALWLLLAVAAVGLAGAIGLVRRRADLARAAGTLAPRLAPAAGRTRPAARLGLSVTGLALVALALSRPQCGTRTEMGRRAGVDVAIVLDASRSMLARDVRPDRLTRAKLEVSALLDRLGGDRVALVVFAGEPFVQCPLTSDTAAVRLFLRAVEADAMPRQGTALGGALLAAKDVLEAARAGPRAKVVLVVSDGEDHEGGAASAARTLADAGIRVFALAVGTAEGAPIPLGDGAGPRRHLEDGRGETVVTRLEAPALRRLAEAADGDVYGLAPGDRGVAAFAAALARMERSEAETRLVVVWEDRYALAAFPGFLLLLGGLLLGEGRRERPRAEEPR